MSNVESRDRTTPAVPGWIVETGIVLVVLAGNTAPFRPEIRSLFTTPLLLLVVVPVVVLQLRRRWPIATFAGCLVLYGISAFLSLQAPGTVMALLIAAFAVANQTERRHALLLGGAGIVVSGTVAAVSAGSLLAPSVSVVMAIGMGIAAGDAVRTRREYVQSIRDRALRAELTRESEAQQRVSEERLRIARDLHDTVAHQISVISLNAGVATASLDDHPDKAKAALATIRVAARSVLNDIGNLMTVLRTGETQTEPTNSPQPGIAQLGQLVQEFRENGLQVRFTMSGETHELSAATNTAVYRIVREALTNAHKHSSNQQAELEIINTAETVEINVRNRTHPNGSATAAASSGFGLIGLRERATAVRGTVQAGPTSDGAGWLVRVSLPTRKEAQP